MKIDLNNEGASKGILIEGDKEELHALALTLAEAADDGHSEGAILTDEGVEEVTIRRV